MRLKFYSPKFSHKKNQTTAKNWHYYLQNCIFLDMEIPLSGVVNFNDEGFPEIVLLCNFNMHAIQSVSPDICNYNLL